MKALFRNRPEIQKLSGAVAIAIDELVTAINTPPLVVNTATVRSGTGTPLNRLVGNPGDLFLRTDGGTSTTLYVKETGTNTSTGWVAK